MKKMDINVYVYGFMMQDIGFLTNR